MSENTAIEQVEQPNWKPKALIIGGLIGAGVGVLAAYLFIQGAEDADEVTVTPFEGIKLGVLVFGMLRNVANIAGD